MFIIFLKRRVKTDLKTLKTKFSAAFCGLLQRHVISHGRQIYTKDVTNEERRALKELATDENIVIIRADKGNCTVVMERTDYQNQIQEMLQDQNVYTTISD